MVLYEIRENGTGTFSINLYVNNAEKNRVDKTDYLVSVGTLTGTLREECNLIAPSISIYMENVINFNYVYIPSFNRYYFVKDITSLVNNLWRVDLEVDVLMSYKTQILNLNAFVSRQENEYDPYMLDELYPAPSDVDITYASLPVTSYTDYQLDLTSENQNIDWNILLNVVSNLDTD